VADRDGVSGKASNASGTVSYGDVDSRSVRHDRGLGTSTPPIRVLDREGRYDGSRSRRKKGTSPAELVRAVRPLLPDDLQVKDAPSRPTRTPRLNDGMSSSATSCSASAASRCWSARS
jgi:hypothetical protein